MIGTLVNTVAVLGGGIIGLLLKKRMPAVADNPVTPKRSVRVD
ncbi:MULTISPECIES: DUF554 family protein [Proteiniphilum]|jgi:uncharacterized membrane protein YqgA involved in biofilm formation|nr:MULTISPECIES: DUF554 family protein [Proteiniphilum]